jgi:adenylate kinase family enzyme
MKCFYLVGYHGCGKTTQANNLEKEFPNLNYIGGKNGLDNIGSVNSLLLEIKKSKQNIIIHGCIYQTEPTILKLSRLTDLHILIFKSLPQTVKERSVKRGADYYNLNQFKSRHNFIKKLPEFKKIYNFKLHIIDNNKNVLEVYKQIRNIIYEAII